MPAFIPNVTVRRFLKVMAVATSVVTISPAAPAAALQLSASDTASLDRPNASAANGQSAAAGNAATDRASTSPDARKRASIAAANATDRAAAGAGVTIGFTGYVDAAAAARGAAASRGQLVDPTDVDPF